jgi:hypothetical protein
MAVRNSGETRVGEGLYTIGAEFFTETLIIHGEITSPDNRLSDHLNSTSVSIEIVPLTTRRFGSGAPVDLSASHAQITKSYLLFIVPVAEPDRPDGERNSAWKWMGTRRCWAGAAGFSIAGTVHVEAGRDPRIILRSLGAKMFLPFTEATVTLPDGAAHDYPIVIVNRYRLEMLALK